MKKALLLVDVQKDFCPGGALPAPRGNEIIPVINTIMDKFDLVIASKDWHPMKTVHFEKWPVHKVLIHHRTGVLEVGEIPVIIAVSAAHRAAAFEACQFAIDTLKETVPIWKKEIFQDGEVWVAAHP